MRVDECIEHVKKSLELAEKCESKLPIPLLFSWGMSGNKTRHFYNNVCNFPESYKGTPNCKYLEIGTFEGISLCSAMFRNSVKATVIDDWREDKYKERSAERDFHQNLKRYEVESNVTIIKSDCFKIDHSKLGKFDVYLYDAGHEEEDQYRGIYDFYDHLEDVAIVIVDDWNGKNVQLGTRKAFQDLGIKPVYEKEIHTTVKAKEDIPYCSYGQTSRFDRGGWWNGLYVCVVNKN